MVAVDQEINTCVGPSHMLVSRFYANLAVLKRTHTFPVYVVPQKPRVKSGVFLWLKNNRPIIQLNV